MPPREREGHDAITSSTAARMLGMAETTVARFRREGLLVRLDGVPSHSRADVEEFIENPWLDGRQAAVVLGVSHERVSQLANADRIPVHVSSSGHRTYRQRHLEVVARARRERAQRTAPPSGDAIGAMPPERGGVMRAAGPSR